MLLNFLCYSFQDNKNDKKGKENDNKLQPILMKAAFWMITTSILMIASSLLVRGDDTQNEV